MASNDLTPAEVNALYSGIYGASNGAQMQTMQTPAQIYSGMYPIAAATAPTSATQAINRAVPVTAPVSTKEQNFYESPGVTQSYVDSIGQPLSASVNQQGQRIVAPSQPADNWNNDPAYLAYVAEQAAGLQPAVRTAVAQPQPQQNTDWSKANPGTTGIFGIPMSPNQQPQNTPTVPAVRLPMMSSSAASPASAPQATVQAPAAPMPIMASTNGYLYTPKAGGGYTQVGQVNPNLTPAQVYAAANAGNTAVSGGGMPSWYSTDNHGGGGGSLAGN